MDREALLKLFARYPKLEMFIGAGTIGLKTAREILDIDRWLMQDIFKELICCGAVKACGNTSWRATEECQQFLAERRQQDVNGQ